jgi:hypothetical protein
MKKKKPEINLPDITEFVDESGRRWIQTTADDLFEIDELNNILDRIEKEKNRDEMVLARIDFQRVDKQYYNAAVELQKKLNKQNEILKKLLKESNEIITRKNDKLKELIQYIKKMHIYISYINSDPSKAGEIPTGVAADLSLKPAAKTKEPVYETITEFPLDEYTISQIK